MSTLITIIITYWLLIIIVIITKSHNNYCSVGVMVLCLLNLLILIVFCVILTLVFSLRACHIWLTRNHVYSWNLGRIYLVHFLKFWNLPCFTREISKFQKSEHKYIWTRDHCVYVLHSDKKKNTKFDGFLYSFNT